MLPGQDEIATDAGVRIEQVDDIVHQDSEDIAVLDYLKTIEDREEVLDDFKEICQKTPEHDMCKKHGSHYHCPSNPDEFLEKPFTDDQKAEMLYFTNEKRSLIANGTENETGASNMREITWDKCLEIVAQRWADQCVNGHDHIEERECPGFNDVGQNIKMNWSTKKDTPLKIEKAVNSWYKEKKDFDEMPNDDRVSNFQFQEYPAIGHYTQLVWADTYKVGCGASWFKDGSKSKSGKFWYKTIIVCNYGPMGNTNHRSMYEEGTACANCPAGFTSCKNSLCNAS